MNFGLSSCDWCTYEFYALAGSDVSKLTVLLGSDQNSSMWIFGSVSTLDFASWLDWNKFSKTD